MADPVKNAAPVVAPKKVRKEKVKRTPEQKSILRQVSAIREDMLLLRNVIGLGQDIPMSAVVAIKTAAYHVNHCIQEVDEHARFIEKKV